MISVSDFALNNSRPIPACHEVPTALHTSSLLSPWDQRCTVGMRQTLQPNPDSREAMAAAFQRHAELGETLFGAKR